MGSESLEARAKAGVCSFWPKSIRVKCSAFVARLRLEKVHFRSAHPSFGAKLRLCFEWIFKRAEF
jgi:hypothetical protein